MGEMKKKGVDPVLPANGPEYQTGQAHGAKRKMLFANGRRESTAGDGASDAKMADAPAAEASEEQSLVRSNRTGRTNTLLLIRILRQSPYLKSRKRGS
jgi:hypothetical protein